MLDRIKMRDRPRRTHIAASTYALPYAQKPTDLRHPRNRTANTAARPASSACHGIHLDRTDQPRKAAKSSPRCRKAIMTSQQQPRMFHVKHIDFERSKTWLLRNMSCLQLFFAARNAGASARLPLYHSVPIDTTPPPCNRPRAPPTRTSRQCKSKQAQQRRRQTATDDDSSQNARAVLTARLDQTHRICRPQTSHPSNATASPTKTAPRSIVGQLLRSLKHSTSIDFLPLFHIKHRLRSGVLPSLSPSALPPSIPLSKDKAYRAVQTRALHSLAIIPRNLHGVPHSIQFRVDLNTLTRSR